MRKAEKDRAMFERAQRLARAEEAKPKATKKKPKVLYKVERGNFVAHHPGQTTPTFVVVAYAVVSGPDDEGRYLVGASWLLAELAKVKP